VARTDLLEREIEQLQRKARAVVREPSTPWEISKIDADRILRLTGELIEIRNREAHVRHIQGLEGDEY
jgi:hypothetical protein